MLKYEIIDNQKEDWVVFVHGVAGSTLTWKKQIEDFSQKYNLLLLDLPGHGQNASTVIKKVNIKKLNNGIKETLDYVGIEKAHFVGMSLGTLVIASFAVMNPSYVKSIVFGGSVILLSGMYKFLIRTINKMKKLLPYKSAYQAFAWFIMPKSNHKTSRKIFLREASKLNKDTMLAWLEYLSTQINLQNLIDQLGKLNIKLFFISGDEDHCFLGGTKKLIKELHNSTIQIIEHCGHVCSIEKYKEFNNCALRYINSITSSLSVAQS